MTTPPAPPLPNEPPGPGAPPMPDPPLPEPDIRPSSPPDGPQVVPAPEPQSDVRDSNPHAAGARGLAGGMGVSSERIPADPTSIEGTGSRGSAVGATDGTWATLGGGSGGGGGDTEPEPTADPRPHPDEPAEGPEMDDRQQRMTQEWREDQPAANVDPVPPPTPGASTGTDWQGIDRTVGEPKP